jgi:hypothetical protein
VAKLREVTEKVVKGKNFIDTIEKLGDEVHYMNGDETTKYWAIESEMMAKIYRQMKKEEAAIVHYMDAGCAEFLLRAKTNTSLGELTKFQVIQKRP